MQFVTLFVLFVTFIDTTCLSKIVITGNERDGFAELEEATIRILTSCYSNQHKTIGLLGDFPSSFLERLSSHGSFNQVLMDYRRREQTFHYDSDIHSASNIQKIHVFVIMASSLEEFERLLEMLLQSIYNNQMASLIIIGWSTTNKFTTCVHTDNIYDLLESSHFNSILNAKLICLNHTKNTVIYNSNPFTKKAPKPWAWFQTATVPTLSTFHLCVREYLGDERICENLDFDKTRDLGGSPITLIWLYFRERYNKLGGKKGDTSNSLKRREWIQWHEHLSFFKVFLTYVNATAKGINFLIVPGVKYPRYPNGVVTRPFHLKSLSPGRLKHSAYPHGIDCKVLIAQFRGNKSQLEKILSVIDGYSWCGIGIAFFVTLIFFRYFLRQPLLFGILNVWRLTCSSGLVTLPPNLAPQIYMGCIWFFFITIHGILTGNLAALLTHDFPVRQIYNIQDLINLGYKVLVEKNDFIYFDDPFFKGHLIERPFDEDCLPIVIDNPLIACLVWDSRDIDIALDSNLHVSHECITREYHTTMLPWNWALQERLNKFLGIMIAGDIMAPLHAKVNKKRLLEAESEEVFLEPEIMTFEDLRFAFEILGVGLACASISFILEVIVYQFQNRVRKTPVIILNRRRNCNIFNILYKDYDVLCTILHYREKVRKIVLRK